VKGQKDRLFKVCTQRAARARARGAWRAAPASRQLALGHYCRTAAVTLVAGTIVVALREHAFAASASHKAHIGSVRKLQQRVALASVASSQ
jgi:hypothetical protein